MIIGLTGPNAAGKGEVARYLERRGFHYFSLSDEIRGEIRQRGLEISRERLIDVGNELRARFGPAVLAERVLSRTASDRNYVVDSIEDLHRELDRVLPRIMSRVPRPDWDEYFMSIARVVAARSNCIKRKVAAIIVKDKRVISTGYNGTPRGARNCNEGGCPRCNSMAKSGTALEECLCCHGEENAITQAAYHGTSVKGATLYTTLAPCLLCTKMIINSGIVEVVYNRDYALNERAFQLFSEAGVFVRKLKVDPS